MQDMESMGGPSVPADAACPHEGMPVGTPPREEQGRPARDSGAALQARIAEAARCLAEGRTEAALNAIAPALDEGPAHPDAIAIASGALLQRGHPWRALALIDAAAGLGGVPGGPPAINRALALLTLGDAAGALSTLRRAGESTLILPGARAVQTAALLSADRAEAALQACEDALRTGPLLPDMLVNRITALLQLDRAAEALAACDDALRRFPEHPLLRANRGLALAGCGRFTEAVAQAGALRDERVLQGAIEALFEAAPPGQPVDRLLGELSRLRATGANPSLLLECGRRLGALFLDADRPAEVLAVCDFAAQSATDSALRVLSARALAAAGEIEAAEATLRAAYETDAGVAGRFTGDFFGEDPRADALILQVEHHVTRLLGGRWDGRSRDIEATVRTIETALAAGMPAPINPHLALLLPLPPLLQRRIAESHGRAYAARTTPLQPTPCPANAERIHVGYLSADFVDHPTAHLVRGLFGCHDRKRFRVTAYALRPADDSPYCRQIVRDADSWVDLHDLDDHTAARRIAGDGVHVLIDLMGYTLHGRPGILAHRPAPVQMNFLGMLGTVGAPCVDYLVCDGVAVPPEHDAWYREAPLRLPVSCQVADDAPPVDPIPVARADEGLPADAFVFCSFNNLQKLTPELFDSWGRILRSVPGSVLWLLQPKTAEQSLRLKREIERRGVNPDRLLFAPRTLKPRHLRRMALGDLFLDSFVFNAATTAVDSLFAGLPLLTLRGDTFPSRIAASLLTDAGLPELIADSRQEYESLAIRLALDPEPLHTLRGRLEQRRASGTLLSTRRFTRHLEFGLALAWRNACAGKPPEPIEIPPIT